MIAQFGSALPIFPGKWPILAPYCVTQYPIAHFIHMKKTCRLVQKSTSFQSPELQSLERMTVNRDWRLSWFAGLSDDFMLNSHTIDRVYESALSMLEWGHSLFIAIISDKIREGQSSDVYSPTLPIPSL